MLEELKHIRYVYHYTSFDTLLVILDNYRRSMSNDGLVFRANNIRKMNDPKEMESIFDFVKAYLSKYEPANVEERFWLHPIACNRKYEEQCKNEYIIDGNGFVTMPTMIPYVTSFSAKRDYLPMWTLYGNMGKGVCLKFDTFDLIKNIRLAESQSFPNDIYKQIGYVCYSHNTVSKDFEKVFLETYKWYLNDYKNKTDQLTVDNKINVIGELCFYLSPFMKYKDYKYEKEFRIAYYRHFGENASHNISIKDLFSPHIYKVDDFIEYIIPISALKEIIIGPSMEKNVIRHVILKELYECNIKIIISESKVPFRLK